MASSSTERYTSARVMPSWPRSPSKGSASALSAIPPTCCTRRMASPTSSAVERVCATKSPPSPPTSARSAARGDSPSGSTSSPSSSGCVSAGWMLPPPPPSGASPAPSMAPPAELIAPARDPMAEFDASSAKNETRRCFRVFPRNAPETRHFTGGSWRAPARSSPSSSAGTPTGPARTSGTSRYDASGNPPDGRTASLRLTPVGTRDLATGARSITATTLTPPSLPRTERKRAG